jgi:hypothetical protein
LATTAVQSNAQPAGGSTAQQPVPPSNAPSQLNAYTNSIPPLVEQFRGASSPMDVTLPTTTFSSGAVSDGGVKLASVGLGYRTLTSWTGTMTIANTSGSTQTINVSPWFPYNLIQNTNVTINGGANVYNVGGVNGLMVAMRNRRSQLFLSEGQPFGPALPQALCNIAVSGTGVTVTNSSTASFSGISTIAITTGNTATITLGFITIEKLAFDRDSLLGALPLQNNSTYATKTHTLNALSGGGAQFPVYQSGGLAAGLAVGISLTELTEYDFWSVPSNPQLYAEMVSNSYQVQEQTNLTVSATGSQAFVYNIPQNMFLIALHVQGRNAATAPVPMNWNDLSNRKVMYNAGSVIPLVQPTPQLRAAQFMDYDRDVQTIAGYAYWDGEDTTEDITNTDQAGWIDCYMAASPQFVCDLASAFTLPLTYNICREQLVMGAVQVVGG